MLQYYFEAGGWKMTIISSIKDILLLITTIATIVSVCMRSIYTFLHEWIKDDFSGSAGENNLFIKSIKLIILFMLIIEILMAIFIIIFILNKYIGSTLSYLIIFLIGIFFIILLTKPIKYFKVKKYKVKCKESYTLLIEAIALILMFFLDIIINKRKGMELITDILSAFILFTLISTISLLFNTKDAYLSKLRNINKSILYKGAKGLTIYNIIISIFLSFLFVLPIFAKNNEEVHKTDTTISITITHNDKLSTKDININKKLKDIIFMSIFSFIMINVATLNISILNVINKLYNPFNIKFITKNNGVVTTNLYLEYKNFYLVIKNGNERYIKKDSVIEIIKIHL